MASDVSAEDLQLALRRRVSPSTQEQMKQFDGVQGGKYYLVQTLPQFHAFLDAAKRQRILAIDTETSGLNWVRDHVCGIVIGWSIKENYYLPINHKTDEKQLDIEVIREGLQELLGYDNKTYVFANAKFDLHGLRQLGIEVKGIIHDIVVQACIIDENDEHSLKSLSDKHIDPQCSRLEAVIKKWRSDESIRRREQYKAMSLARAEDYLGSPNGRQVAEDYYRENLQEKPDEKITLAKLVKAVKEILKPELSKLLCSKNSIDDISYDYVPLDIITPYACADVHYTLLLHKTFIATIAAHTASRGVYANEMILTRALFEMEHYGAKIDIEYLKTTQPQLTEEAAAAEKAVYDAVGYQFNIASSQQLVAAFQKMGVVLTKLSKKSKEAIRAGNMDKVAFSMDKEVLEGLASKYAFAEQVLKFRMLEKLNSTYVIGLQELADHNGFVHTSYNQNVSTGRMSSAAPNLTNIPARNKVIRRAFILPGGEYVFVFIDFSQVELRLTATVSEDPSLLACYPFEGEGKDVHTMTLADVVLSRPLEEVKLMKANKEGHISDLSRGQSCSCQSCLYDFYRNIAKRVNFGIIYGAGPEAIQRQVQTPSHPVSEEECSEYIRKYFQRYPGVQYWIKETQLFMKRHGFVQNTFGRYRRLPTKGLEKWQVERACRQGVNFLIQGEAADLFKVAIARVDAILKGRKTRLINVVHDEIQFYWHKDELHLLPEVKAAMEDWNYKVPIVAEASWSATDWSTKKELKS